MSKISALPEELAPDGSETVVLLKAGEVKRAKLGTLVAGALAPVAARVRDLSAIVNGLVAPRVSGIAAAPNPVELGSAEAVAVNWNVTAAPASQTFTGVAVAADARSAQLAGPWNADRQATLAISDGGTPEHTDAATVTVFARAPIFAGLAAAALPTAAETIGAAYKALDSDRIARGFALDTAAGGFPFVVYPAALTVSAITLGGFAVGGWAESAAYPLTLANGATIQVKRVSLDHLAASAGTIGVTLA